MHWHRRRQINGGGGNDDDVTGTNVYRCDQPELMGLWNFNLTAESADPKLPCSQGDSSVGPVLPFRWSSPALSEAAAA